MDPQNNIASSPQQPQQQAQPQSPGLVTGQPQSQSPVPAAPDDDFYNMVSVQAAKNATNKKQYDSSPQTNSGDFSWYDQVASQAAKGKTTSTIEPAPTNTDTSSPPPDIKGAFFDKMRQGMDTYGQDHPNTVSDWLRTNVGQPLEKKATDLGVPEPPKAPTTDTEAVSQANKGYIQQTNQALGKQVGQDQPVSYDANQLKAGEKALISSGNTDTSKVSAFNKLYPNGDMQSIQETGQKEKTLIFRTDKNQPYVRLTPSNAEQWQKWYGTLDKNISDEDRAKLFLPAIVDLFENNSRDATVAAVSTMLSGGSSTIWGTLLKTGPKLVAANVATTTAADKALQAGGIDPGQTTSQSAQEGFKRGIDAFIGVLTAQSIVSTANTIAGKGIMHVGEEAKAAIAATERLKEYVRENGLGPEVEKYLHLMPQQVLEMPLFRRYANKIAALLPQIPEFVKGQKNAGFDIAQSKVDQNALDAGLKTSEGIIPEKTGTLPSAVKDFEDFTTTQRGPTNPRASSFDTGQALSSDLADYEKRSQAVVNGKYAAARAIEEPKFDPAPALKAADDVGTGTHTVTNYEKTPIYGAETDAQGNPIQVQSSVNKETSPIATPQPALQSIIDRINIWRDNPPMPVAVKQPDGTIIRQSTTDQVNALREEAWRLSQPGPAGETRGDEAAAKKVYMGLTKMLDNTQNTSPAFQQAWKDASAAARERFENLENPLVRRGYKQDETGMVTTPESTLKSLMADSGRQVSNLDYLKSVVKPETYDAMIASKKTELLNDPYSLADKMTKMDLEFQKRLFTDPTELQQYKDVGTIFKNLKESGIQDAIQKQNNMAQFVDAMVQKGQQQTESFRQLRSLTQIYPNSPAAQSTRAGIIDKLIHDSWTSDKGLDHLNASQFTTWLHEAGRKDMLQFLTPEDIQHLKDLNSFMAFAQSGKNMADSFAAAGAASKVSHLEHEAVLMLAEAGGMGALLTSPGFAKFLYGNGTARFSISALKRAASAYASFNQKPFQATGDTQ